MKKIINLLGHGIFYTLAMGIESIAPFILAPVLTHYLTLYEYGLWAIFQSSMSFLRPLLGLTLEDYVRMRYFHHSKEKMVGYLFSILVVSGILAVGLWLIVLIFPRPASELLEFPAPWLWAIIAAAWLHSTFGVVLAYFQLETQHKRFAIIQAVQSGVTLLLSILLVMAGMNWTGAIIGKLIGLAAGCGIAMLWIVLHFPKSAEKYIDPARAIELMSFGLRYLPNGMVMAVIILTDRLMLAHMQDVQAASLFAVASLFPMVLFIAIQGFIAGWQPWCFSRLARHEPGDAGQLLGGAAVYFILLPIGGVIMAYAAIWLGPYVIDKQFHGAFVYVFPLTMAMVAQGFYFFARSILHFYRRLELLSFIALAAMVLNILLNYLLIGRMGILGSAWATGIAYMAAFLLTTVFAWVTLKKNYLTGRTHVRQ